MKKSIRIPRGKKEAAPFFVSINDTETELDIVIEEDASLTLVCVQNTPCSHGTIHQRTSIGAGAAFHLINITLEGDDVHHDLIARIEGAGGKSTIDWIFYGRGSMKQSLSARNIFDAPCGRGEITVHGVAEDHAQVSFDGCIEITKNGGGTDSYLTEKTLMLDATAKVDAVPGLEIKTNDVKASHSASISKVSNEDLFYFASRGIGEQEARRMYIEGFLGALLERIPDHSLREQIMMEIAKKYEEKR